MRQARTPRTYLTVKRPVIRYRIQLTPCSCPRTWCCCVSRKAIAAKMMPKRARLYLLSLETLQAGNVLWGQFLAGNVAEIAFHTCNLQRPYSGFPLLTFRIAKPESQIKKTKQAAKTAEQVAAEKKARKAANKEKRAAIFKRTEAYTKEYADAERALIAAKREAKANGSYYVEAEPKLVFVVRIKGINKIAPKPRKVLQLLRLTQINAGVFVKVTKATSELIKLVEPYVAYGYPSLSTIRHLIYKRGYGKINKQRIPLSDNAIIEASLGKYGIISIEDLIHEIYTVGPNFKQANNFLWPFKLSNPSGGWGVRRKFQHFIQGGSTGNREHYINDLVKKMN